MKAVVLPGDRIVQIREFADPTLAQHLAGSWNTTDRSSLLAGSPALRQV